MVSCTTQRFETRALKLPGDLLWNETFLFSSHAINHTPHAAATAAAGTPSTPPPAAPKLHLEVWVSKRWGSPSIHSWADLPLGPLIPLLTSPSSTITTQTVLLEPTRKPAGRSSKQTPPPGMYLQLDLVAAPEPQLAPTPGRPDPPSCPLHYYHVASRLPHAAPHPLQCSPLMQALPIHHTWMCTACVCIACTGRVLTRSHTTHYTPTLPPGPGVTPDSKPSSSQGGGGGAGAGGGAWSTTRQVLATHLQLMDTYPVLHTQLGHLYRSPPVQVRQHTPGVYC